MSVLCSDHLCEQILHFQQQILVLKSVCMIFFPFMAPVGCWSNLTTLLSFKLPCSSFASMAEENVLQWRAWTSP